MPVIHSAYDMYCVCLCVPLICYAQLTRSRCPHLLPHPHPPPHFRNRGLCRHMVLGSSLSRRWQVVFQRRLSAHGDEGWERCCKPQDTETPHREAIDTNKDPLHSASTQTPFPQSAPPALPPGYRMHVIVNVRADRMTAGCLRSDVPHWPSNSSRTPPAYAPRPHHVDSSTRKSVTVT
jgi:hypothetical protein